MRPIMNCAAAPAAVSRVIAGQLMGDHAALRPAPSEAGFIPVVVIQRWRSLSAVATTFAFLRSNKALRAALAAGQSILLPEMPPAARNAGIFALLLTRPLNSLSMQHRRPGGGGSKTGRARASGRGVS